MQHIRKPLNDQIYDEYSLAFTFTLLDFKVKVHRDLTRDEMRDIAKYYSDKIKHDTGVAGAFVMIVLCHGSKNDVVSGTDGQTIPLRTLIENFKPENCSKLKEVPKIFIVDACRGSLEEKQHSFNANKGCSDVQVPASNEDDKNLFRINESANFALIYATSYGKVAILEEELGSTFTQAMVKQLFQAKETEEFIIQLRKVRQTINGCEIKKNPQTPASLDQLLKPYEIKRYRSFFSNMCTHLWKKITHIIQKMHFTLKRCTVCKCTCTCIYIYTFPSFRNTRLARFNTLQKAFTDWEATREKTMSSLDGMIEKFDCIEASEKVNFFRKTASLSFATGNTMIFIGLIVYMITALGSIPLFILGGIISIISGIMMIGTIAFDLNNIVTIVGEAQVLIQDDYAKLNTILPLANEMIDALNEVKTIFQSSLKNEQHVFDTTAAKLFENIRGLCYLTTNLSLRKASTTLISELKEDQVTEMKKVIAGLPIIPFNPVYFIRNMYSKRCGKPNTELEEFRKVAPLEKLRETLEELKKERNELLQKIKC